jgi:hypothetical protein
MSHRRHTWAAVVGSVAALTLLSGCFGSDSQEPTAAHRTRHHPRSTEPTTPTTPTAPTTSAPTSPTSPSVSPAVLSFNPKPGGKHQKDCERLQPGDDPAEFLFYPVVITPAQSVTLDDVGTQHSVGIVDAGAWVAPAGSTPETGTFKGWPPAKIVTRDPNLQWSERVPAKGAQLQAGVAYNVFLRLQVDPTPGDSRVKAIDFSFPGDSNSTAVPAPMFWRADTTFSMSC